MSRVRRARLVLRATPPACRLPSPLTVLVLVALTLLLGACGSENVPVSVDAVDELPPEQEIAQQDFRVILAGAASDTLTGRAIYGRVINARTGAIQLVVKLDIGADFVGGLFIARGDTIMPEVRGYSLHNAYANPDSLGGFMVSYQEGLLRQLKSESGTVTFSHVSDTLLSGSLEATLRGRVPTGRGGQTRTGEIHMSGRFNARPGIIGFVVGL